MISAIPQDTKKKTRESSQNITERKKAEETLRETSQYLENLFNYANAPIIVWDPQFKITRFNHAFETLTGRSAHDVIGKSIEILFPTDKVESSMEFIRGALEGKRLEVVEINILHLDGAVRTVLWNSATLFGLDGKTPVATIAQGQDITERKKAQEQVQVSEAKFRNIFDNAKDGLILADLENKRFLMCNKSICRMLGYTEDELKRLGVKDIHLEKDLPYATEQFGRLAKEEIIFVKDLPVKRKDGSIFYAEVVGSSIISEGKKCLMGSFRDITERKWTEEELKFKTAILEAESEASVDGILIVDKNGKTLLINKRFGEMWGIPQEVLDTKDDKKMLQYVAAKLTNPDEFIAKVKYLYAHKDEKSMEEIEFKDGEVFERYSAPLTDTEHKYLGRTWYFHDTTALKQAEIKLRAEKAKLEKYFDIIGIIVIVIGTKGEIFLLNKKGCEMLGYQPSEVVGKNWITDFLSKDKKAKPGNFLGGLLKDGTDNAYFEHSVFTKDGKEKKITWGSIPIRDEAGNVQAFLCAGEDVTILRQAEVTITQLKEFDRLKDEFLNIAAHELKTPLTSIIGLSEIIKAQKTCLPSQMAEYPDIIYNEGLRLGRVVRRILTITRYESGKEVIHPEPINLTAFVSSLLPGFNILTKDKKVTIATNLKEENMQIESDKEMISEVIINLVDNSIKYGPENQTITISAYRIDSGIDKERVRIEVADQGPGIPPDSINKLFNKFSQLEPSLSRSQEGSGLGLYICNLLVEKLGGRIGVESEVGKGSKFFFNLPLTCPSA
jgi:PAS domain S-box-containing protein